MKFKFFINVLAKENTSLLSKLLALGIPDRSLIPPKKPWRVKIWFITQKIHETEDCGYGGTDGSTKLITKYYWILQAMLKLRYLRQLCTNIDKNLSNIVWKYISLGFVLFCMKIYEIQDFEILLLWEII